MKILRYIYMLVLVAMLASCRSDKDVLDMLDPDTEQQDDSGESGDGVRDMELTIPASARFVELFSMQLSSSSSVGNDSSIKSANVHFSGRDSAGDYTVEAVVLYTDNVFQIVFEDSDDLSFVPLGASYMIRYFEFLDDDGASEGLIPVGVICDISSSGEATIVSNIGDYYNGTGVADDPYIIATSDDFNELINDKLSSSNLYGIYFEQGASINGAELDYVECEFDGQYSGGSITGDISNTISGLSLPLFYKLTANATVKDLTIEDILLYTNSTEDGIGALAVTAVGPDITNVKLLGGNVVGYKNVGGFVGDGYATFSSCYNYVNVSTIASGGSAIGGYLGDAHYGMTVTFRDCVYRGEINAPGSDCVGGLVGYDYSDVLSITRCYVSGLISGASGTGGLIGKTSAVTSINISDSCVGRGIQIDSSDVAGTVVQSVIIRGCGSGVGGIIGEIWEASGYSGTVTITDTTIERSSATDVTFTVTGSSDDVSSVGGMVGAAYKVAFKGCSFTNNSARVGSDKYALERVGGVIGYADDVSFDSSEFTNSGVVNTSGDYAGGVVGLLCLSSAYGTSFTGSTFTNNATVVNGGSYVGGCVGSVEELDNTKKHEIKMMNNGSVSGADYVGGISGAVYTHGFVDLSDSGLFVDDRYTSGYIAGNEYVGGYYGRLCITSSSNGDIPVEFNNSSKISVSGSSNSVGGMIGLCSASSSCSATIYIKVNEPQYIDVIGTNDVGGCIGHIDLDYSGAEVIVTTENNIRGGLATGEYDRDGMVNASGYNAGGLVGHYTASYTDTSKTYLTFKNCYNKIDVVGSGSSSYNFGGIIGYAENLVLIEQCCNLADITSSGEGDSGSGASVGGIVGRLRNLYYIDTDDDEIEDDTVDYRHTIMECYNMGAISDLNESKQRGGIVGYARCAVDVYNCFNAGSVEAGGTYVAGIVGCFSDVSNKDYRYKIHYCYNIGVTGWGIIGGDEDLNNNELSRSLCYYYSGSASGDLDTNNSGSSTSYDKTYMNLMDLFLMDLFMPDAFDELLDIPDCWTDPGRDSLPYLTDLYYESYPVIDY